MSPFALTRLAVSTPLGLTTRATQVAYAAGLTSFKRIDPLGGDNETVRASRYLAIGDAPSLPREERMLFFACRALADCVLGWSRENGPLTCYLALPEPDPEAPLDVQHLRRRLRASVPAGVQIDWNARSVTAGRAGFFELVQTAKQDLISGATQTALIGGLDSMCDTASLRSLGRRRMLLGPENLDGRIPGEGAGFVCLSRLSSYVRPQATIDKLAQDRDRLPFDQRNPMHAVALSSVFRTLQQSAGELRPNQLISCQPQEGLWGRELSNAYLRAVSLMPEPYRATQVASGVGDTGAAAPFVGLAAALHWMQNAKRVGRRVQRVVMYGASDEGAVGAAILDAAQ